MFDIFDYFRKPRREREEEHVEDEILLSVIERMKAYHRVNKFKSTIVLDYILKAYQSNDTIEELYETIILKKKEEEENF